MLLANKMAEVRLVSCARMRSHDTQARQLTTVNVHTACRGFCLWILLRSHRPAGRNTEVFPNLKGRGLFAL